MGNTPAPWHKSTYSSAVGECVEVAALPNGRVGVRDSKRPEAGHLTVTPAHWTAFLGGVRTDFA